MLRKRPLALGHAKVKVLLLRPSCRLTPASKLVRCTHSLGGIILLNCIGSALGFILVRTLRRRGGWCATRPVASTKHTSLDILTVQSPRPCSPGPTSLPVIWVVKYAAKAYAPRLSSPRPQITGIVWAISRRRDVR